jgi:hypothetical protein
MRRLFGWMAGLVSVAALAKLYHRRRHDARPVETPGSEADPAEELRRKLDEVRGAGAPDDGAGPTAGPVDTAEETADETATGATIEERRAAIHAQAQEAIDAMRGDDT